MKSLKENFQKAHIVIIGSGIIGKFNALELSELGFRITIIDPDEEKFKKLEKFVCENNDQNLRILERDSIFIKNINKAFQTKNIKGMISYEDGRINPFSLLQTLDKYLKHKKINFSKGEIIKIRKSNNQWISTTRNNENIKSDMVILCNSCLLYTSPSPRDRTRSRMPSSA